MNSPSLSTVHAQAGAGNHHGISSTLNQKNPSRSINQAGRDSSGSSWMMSSHATGTGTGTHGGANTASSPKLGKNASNIYTSIASSHPLQQQVHLSSSTNRIRSTTGTNSRNHSHFIPRPDSSGSRYHPSHNTSNGNAADSPSTPPVTLSHPVHASKAAIGTASKSSVVPTSLKKSANRNAWADLQSQPQIQIQSHHSQIHSASHTSSQTFSGSPIKSALLVSSSSSSSSSTTAAALSNRTSAHQSPPQYHPINQLHQHLPLPSNSKGRTPISSASSISKRSPSSTSVTFFHDKKSGLDAAEAIAAVTSAAAAAMQMQSRPTSSVRMARLNSATSHFSSLETTTATTAAVAGAALQSPSSSTATTNAAFQNPLLRNGADDPQRLSSSPETMDDLFVSRNSRVNSALQKQKATWARPISASQMIGDVHVDEYLTSEPFFNRIPVKYMSFSLDPASSQYRIKDCFSLTSKAAALSKELVQLGTSRFTYEELETHIQKELNLIEPNEDAFHPNRLRILSYCFSMAIDSFRIYMDILSRIKTEYDQVISAAVCERDEIVFLRSKLQKLISLQNSAHLVELERKRALDIQNAMEEIRIQNADLQQRLNEEEKQFLNQLGQLYANRIVVHEENKEKENHEVNRKSSFLPQWVKRRKSVATTYQEEIILLQKTRDEYKELIENQTKNKSKNYVSGAITKGYQLYLANRQAELQSLIQQCHHENIYYQRVSGRVGKTRMEVQYLGNKIKEADEAIKRLREVLKDKKKIAELTRMEYEKEQAKKLLAAAMRQDPRDQRFGDASAAVIVVKRNKKNVREKKPAVGLEISGQNSTEGEPKTAFTVSPSPMMSAKTPAKQHFPTSLHGSTGSTTLAGRSSMDMNSSSFDMGSQMRSMWDAHLDDEIEWEVDTRNVQNEIGWRRLRSALAVVRAIRSVAFDIDSRFIKSKSEKPQKQQLSNISSICPGDSVGPPQLTFPPGYCVANGGLILRRSASYHHLRGWFAGSAISNSDEDSGKDKVRPLKKMGMDMSSSTTATTTAARDSNRDNNHQGSMHNTYSSSNKNHHRPNSTMGVNASGTNSNLTISESNHTNSIKNKNNRKNNLNDSEEAEDENEDGIGEEDDLVNDQDHSASNNEFNDGDDGTQAYPPRGLDPTRIPIKQMENNPAVPLHSLLRTHVLPLSSLDLTLPRDQKAGDIGNRDHNQASGVDNNDDDAKLIVAQAPWWLAFTLSAYSLAEEIIQVLGDTHRRHPVRADENAGDAQGDGLDDGIAGGANGNGGMGKDGKGKNKRGAGGPGAGQSLLARLYPGANAAAAAGGAANAARAKIKNASPAAQAAAYAAQWRKNRRGAGNGGNGNGLDGGLGGLGGNGGNGPAANFLVGPQGWQAQSLRTAERVGKSFVSSAMRSKFLGEQAPLDIFSLIGGGTVNTFLDVENTDLDAKMAELEKQLEEIGRGEQG